MNRAERIYELHALLQEEPRSLARMQQNLEVSRATVVRDLDYMKDFMGAPIECDRPSNGYRYQATSPKFELPGFWLNESELFALLAGARLFELVQPGLLAPYVGPLRARIRSLLGQSGHSVTAVDERILLQPFATRTTHPERFGAVAGAVLEGHQLVIQYHGRERDRLSDRTVHPQRLLRYRDHSYLAAHCDQAAALRIFSLGVYSGRDGRVGKAHAGGQSGARRRDREPGRLRASNHSSGLFRSHLCPLSTAVPVHLRPSRRGIDARDASEYVCLKGHAGLGPDGG